MASAPSLDVRYGDIVTKIKGYLPNSDMELFRRAYDYATEMHDGQTRKSGEPYIGHPLEVAHITADLHLDQHSLVAALLHDTVEDTTATVPDIKKRFGDEPAFLVDGLTKINKLQFKSREDAQAENIRKLIVAMGRDVRVVLIKLADRLHNIRTLDHMAAAKQRRIAQETLDIYAPLANRLGINWIKNELEDESLRYLNPEGYEALKARVNRTRAQRTAFVRGVSDTLRRQITAREFSAEIQGRPKHFFSIHKKMQRSGADFDEIYDLTAFRIIVADRATCYEVLGVVHDLWPPVPGRFKDYIAVPKPNGYQSLHTTVVGPEGERIEIQIRSHEMHRVAEHGVAAHWAYKEGRTVLDPDSKQFAWLRELVENQEDVGDSQQYLDSVKLDLFADEVFVFTPDGDIKSLPKGATPLDFAYSIHSEVGDHAVHARVNGRGVSLRYVLQNGDRVEILTRTDQHPREEWLDIVKSSRAKAKIRQYIRREKRERAKEVAKNLLTAELRRYGVRYDSALKSGDLQAAAELLKLQNVEQLLIAVGYGKVQKETVAAKIIPPETKPKDAAKSGPVRKFGERLAQFIGRPIGTKVKLAGMDGEILVSYARCCNPVYGEEIAGYVTRGRGVVVHGLHCSRIQNLEEERQVEVEWETLGHKGDDKTRRRVTVRVVCRDEPGLLSEMSAAFASRGVNIAEAHCRTMDDGLAHNTFEVLVINVGQLNEAVKTVGKIEGVISVERVRA